MNPGILVGAGFLLGSVGMKALTSDKAKQVYVKGLVQGMRAKEEVETVIDEARAQFDDLLAEAEYIKESEDGVKEEAPALESGEEADPDAASEKTAKPAKAAASTDVADQVKKVAAAVAKSATGSGRGAGKGGHGHGHGRGGK